MTSLWRTCTAALPTLLLAQTIALAQAPAPAPASGGNYAFAQPLGPTPRSMSLVLLVGQMSGPPVSDDVPMSARKALDELREFLPFKSYRLYDTGVIGMPSETLPAVVRLRGASVAGQEAQLVEVQVMKPKNAGSLDVTVREVGQSELTKPAATATVSSPTANLMAASVRVNAGETVVVGASRVRGDKALVLLITGMSTSLGSSEPTRAPRPAPGTFFRGRQQPLVQPGQPQIQPPQPRTQPAPPSVQPAAPAPPVAPQAPLPARPQTASPAAPATPAPAPATPAPSPSRSPQ